MITVEQMINQLSTLIKECEDFTKGLAVADVKKEEKLRPLRHRLQAAINRCTTPDDSYRKDLSVARDQANLPLQGIDLPGIASAKRLLLIAEALHADLQAGWVQIE